MKRNVWFDALGFPCFAIYTSVVLVDWMGGWMDESMEGRQEGGMKETIKFSARFDDHAP